MHLVSSGRKKICRQQRGHLEHFHTNAQTNPEELRLAKHSGTMPQSIQTNIPKTCPCDPKDPCNCNFKFAQGPTEGSMSELRFACIWHSLRPESVCWLPQLDV